MKLIEKVKVAVGTVIAAVIALLWYLWRSEARTAARTIAANRTYQHATNANDVGSGLRAKDVDLLFEHERKKAAKEIRDAKREEIVEKFHREFRSESDEEPGRRTD